MLMLDPLSKKKTEFIILLLPQDFHNHNLTKWKVAMAATGIAGESNPS